VGAGQTTGEGVHEQTNGPHGALGTDRSDVRVDPTGQRHPSHDGVDTVLDSLATLDELPVDAHPPVYESAQVTLRGMLDDVREDAPGGARTP
jgi:hypothetical protein